MPCLIVYRGDLHGASTPLHQVGRSFLSVPHRHQPTHCPLSSNQKYKTKKTCDSPALSLRIFGRNGNSRHRPLGLPHGPHRCREDVPAMVNIWNAKYRIICSKPSFYPSTGGTPWRTLWSMAWSCSAWSSAPPPSSTAHPCIAHPAYPWVTFITTQLSHKHDLQDEATQSPWQAGQCGDKPSIGDPPDHHAWWVKTFCTHSALGETWQFIKTKEHPKKYPLFQASSPSTFRTSFSSLL